MEIVHNILSFFKGNLRDDRVYMDYASVTPIDPRVGAYVRDVSRRFFANPASLYREGVAAGKLLEEQRARVARSLTVHADEITFTSGGTESNNIALRMMIDLGRQTLVASGVLDDGELPQVVTTRIEHPAVLEVLKSMVAAGEIELIFVDVDESGVPDPVLIKKALTERTVLVSVMMVNNEIGTIAPIADIAKVVRAFRKYKNSEAADEADKTSAANVAMLPFFHTDAAQAPAYLNVYVPKLGIDALTLDGGKVYGPRAVGALYMSRALRHALKRANIQPLMQGGGQEDGMRSGTPALPQIAGFAYALELAEKEREREVARLEKLRDRLLEGVQKITPSATVNGSLTERVVNNLNICIPGTDAEFSVLRFDAHGIALSSVTSCRNNKDDTSSYVIEAIHSETSEPKACASSSLRITLGRFTKARDISKFLSVYKKLFAGQ